MKVEDLLKVLRDAGLQDEEIKALLEEALASMNGEEKEEEQKEEVPAVEETEDEKMNRVFGI